MGANLLHRKSTGLTDTHRALITLLAEAAVAQYLAETESDRTAAAAPAGLREEAARW